MQVMYFLYSYFRYLVFKKYGVRVSKQCEAIHNWRLLRFY